MSGHHDQLLISSQSSQTTCRLHEFILCHLWSKWNRSCHIRVHFQICSSCSRLIENYEGFMVRNRASPWNVMFWLHVINFPFTILVAEWYTYVFTGIEHFMLSNPRHNLFFERLSYTKGSSINNAINFFPQGCINKSFPLTGIALFYQANFDGKFGNQMNHFSISSLNRRYLTRFPRQPIRIEPMIIFRSRKPNRFLNICKIPSRCSDRLLILSQICWENTFVQPKSNCSSIGTEEFIKFLNDGSWVLVDLLGVLDC